MTNVNGATPVTVQLECGDYKAEINTFGAGIKALTFQNKPLVETYEDPADPPLAAGLVLAPWPNRVEDGRFSHLGHTHQLNINEPDRNNAIHGLVHDKVWEVDTQSAPTYQTVRLHYDIRDAQGWPWPVRAQAEYELTESGLHATFSFLLLEQAPEEGVPLAFGWHTYLSPLGQDVNTATMQINLDEQLPLDPTRLLPCADRTASEVVTKIAQGVAIADVTLDDCFHASQGPVTATVLAAAGGVELRCSKGLDWAQIFTTDMFPGRERVVAIEPMSAPPNALVTNTDLRTLLPGQEISFQIAISALPAPSTS